MNCTQRLRKLRRLEHRQAEVCLEANSQDSVQLRNLLSEGALLSEVVEVEDLEPNQLLRRRLSVRPQGDSEHQQQVPLANHPQRQHSVVVQLLEAQLLLQGSVHLHLALVQHLRAHLGVHKLLQHSVAVVLELLLVQLVDLAQAALPGVSAQAVLQAVLGVLRVHTEQGVKVIPHLEHQLQASPVHREWEHFQSNIKTQ